MQGDRRRDIGLVHCRGLTAIKRRSIARQPSLSIASQSATIPAFAFDAHMINI
jgi:hypothetical protein